MVEILKKPALKTVKEVRQNDGWYNIVSGLGTNRDKITASQVAWKPTTRPDADAIFAADEMGNKIARIIPHDGTREGVTWNMDENSDQESVVKFIETEFRRLGVWSTLAWSWTLGRVYGGAVIFLNVDDGRALDKPLRVERVKSVRSLLVIDRWSLEMYDNEIIDDLSSPFFGTPEFYYYNRSNDVGTSSETVKIHHTRMIRFDGSPLPARLYKRNQYWHDSIYGYLYKSIRNFAVVNDAIASVISEFNQPVYRIEGLSEAIAQDQDELVYKKLKTVDMMRSTVRAIVLDKEDEFQNVSTSSSGVGDLIAATTQRLVAGSDIPHTRLLGNSPSGLGATGEAELINYYDSVKSMQELHLRKPIEALVDLIFAQSTANVAKPDDLTFEFNDLFQNDTETEQKARERQALIDEKYITMGVYDAQECADSRFATGRYSYETVLDKDKVRVANPDLSATPGENASDPATANGLDRRREETNNDETDILDLL
jgi:phage-related protein (TIGR01555 family)